MYCLQIYKTWSVILDASIYISVLLFQCHLLFGTVSAEVPCTHPPDWGRVRHRVRQLLHEEAPRGPELVQLVALLEWPGPVCCACVCVVNVVWSMLCGQCCVYGYVNVCSMLCARMCMPCGIHVNVEERTGKNAK